MHAYIQLTHGMTVAYILLFEVMHEAGDGEEALVELTPLVGSLGTVGESGIEPSSPPFEFSEGETTEGQKADQQVEVIAH